MSRRELSLADFKWLKEIQETEVDWWPTYLRLSTWECTECGVRLSEHVALLHRQRTAHRMVLEGRQAA